MQKKLTLKKERLKTLTADLLVNVVSGLQLDPALGANSADGSLQSCNVF